MSYLLLDFLHLLTYFDQAPRKSILKTSVTPNVDPSAVEGGDATQSMEMTMDFTVPLHGHTSRKSLGRRVSFANTSHVWMFPTKLSNNSSDSPDSSPSSSSAQAPDHNPVTDENDYPGRNNSRRHSSIRYSMAQSEDMDLT